MPPNDILTKFLPVALAIDFPIRQKLADQARRHVIENFTVELMCERTLDVYKSLVGSESDVA